MNNENMTQDEKILLKARRRVKMRCTFTFILLILFHALLFAGFYLGYLESDVSNIYPILLLMASSEICLFGFFGILLGFGKKFFRFLYWFVPLFSFCLLIIPVQYAFNDLVHSISYIVWILASFIKTVNIYRLKNQDDLY